MNQSTTLKKEKLYCKYCKKTPSFKIPGNVDLLSPASDVFVRDLVCPLCHIMGDVRR